MLRRSSLCIVTLTALLSATGCGDTGGDDDACTAEIPEAPTAPELPNPVSEDNAPTGTVAGRMVHPNGTPIEGLRMLACTASICYWSDTDSDGRFTVGDLTLEPLKMQTGDPAGAHLDLVFLHVLDTEEVSELGGTVIVPTLSGDTTPWSDDGGTITLADGELELHAEAGALSYPFGTKEDAIRAVRIAGTDLPPYHWAPWEGQEEETFAYVLNPLGVEADPPATVRVLDVVDTLCERYRVWTISPKTGAVSSAGTATVTETEEGTALVLDTAVGQLTTLVFSPVTP